MRDGNAVYLCLSKIWSLFEYSDVYKIRKLGKTGVRPWWKVSEIANVSHSDNKLVAYSLAED